MSKPQPGGLRTWLSHPAVSTGWDCRAGVFFPLFCVTNCSSCSALRTSVFTQGSFMEKVTPELWLRKTGRKDGEWCFWSNKQHRQSSWVCLCSLNWPNNLHTMIKLFSIYECEIGCYKTMLSGIE